MNEKKEKLETLEEMSIKWYDFFTGVIFLLMLIYGIAAIVIFSLFGEASFSQKEFNFKLMINIKPIIALLVVTFLVHWLEHWGMMRQSARWEDWAEKKLAEKELETKQTIQKESAELKKELLETKTELLLTQNKLREEQERNKKEKI